MKMMDKKGLKMMKNIFEDNGIFWKYVNFILILIISIMCLVLACGKTFGYDEAYTVGMIYRDVSDIIDITSNDVHTPFYYLVLKFFYTTIGLKKLESIKIFSAIFYIIYLHIGGNIAERHFNKKIKFFWLILSGFMPAMIIQSTSARMYTFALLWVSVAAYTAYSLYQEEKRSKWILLVVSTIIAIYIHTFSMIEMVIVFLVFMIAVLLKKRYKTFRYILICGIVVSCSYIPWLLVLWKQFSRWAGWESGWSNTIQPFGWNSIEVYFAEWFSSIDRPQSGAICFGIVLFLWAGFYAVKYVREQKTLLPILGLMIAVIVLVIAVLVSILIVPCFLGRYLFPLSGAVWLFMAVGMYRMQKSWKQIILILGVVISGSFAFYEEVCLEDETGLNHYRAHIESQWEEGDIIMADSYFTMMMSIFFPEADYMVYGNMPKCIPFGNCEAFTKWEQLEGVDTVWYISFNDFRVGSLEEKYVCVEKLDIPYSYYHVVLERYVIRE